MKKYKLVEEYSLGKECCYRLIALRDFSDVKAGEKGGWVESEDNLSHEGECWIYDDSFAVGDCRVSGNAKISRYGGVSGNATVSGNARIRNHARVDGFAFVVEDAIVNDSLVSGLSFVRGNARVIKASNITGGMIRSTAVVDGLTLSGSVILEDGEYRDGNVKGTGILKGCDLHTLYTGNRLYTFYKLCGNEYISNGHKKYNLKDYHDEGIRNIGEILLSNGEKKNVKV